MFENVTFLTWIIFIGIFLSGVGSLLLTRVQYKESANYEKKLNAKTEEITKLNKEIADSVIGGDSYCFLGIGIGDGSINDPLITLEHQGKNPLYDVSIDLVDMGILAERLKKGNLILTMEDAQLGRTHFDIGNVPSHSHYRILQSIHLPNDKNQASYNVFISARNGSFIQNIRLVRVNGKWKLAQRFSKDIGGDISLPLIFQYVDDDFPKDHRGEVKW